MLTEIKAIIKNNLASLFWRMVRSVVRVDIAPPPQGNVVVIAPHPDDETFACGATIARLRAQETKTHIIIVSDGSAATCAKGQTPKELAKIRKQEARAAAQALGVPDSDVSFLGFQDGELYKSEKAVAFALNEALASLSPSLIFAPHKLDAHPDHRLVAEIMDKLPLKCVCYRYLTWVPVRGFFGALLELATHERQIRIPMRRHKERKILAIDCYPSQTGGMKYQENKGFLPPSFIGLFLQEDEVFFMKPNPPLPPAG
ncbi:MAG: PIG-L deacetylase family protein [Bdellovibrionales bacterium]